MEAELRKVIDENRSTFMSEIYQQEPSIRFKKAMDQQYWYSSFDRVFVGSLSPVLHRDDLLFYVKYNSKLKKEEVDAVRTDSKCLPDLLDPYVFWDETFYLNFLLHEIEFHLTFCTLVPGSSSAPPLSRVKRKVSMQVFPSYTERRMDKKDRQMTIGYPNLMFCVDNFTEAFQDITVTDYGEKVAVQIIATNPSLVMRKVIFIGGLDFRVLKRACTEKENMRSSISLQSMFRLTKKKSAPELHEALHFIPMAGPNGKGHAEMAICISDCVPQTEKEHHSTQTDFRTDIKPTSTGIHIASSPIINDTESRQTPLLETNLVSNFVETVSKTDPTSLKNKSSKTKQLVSSSNAKKHDEGCIINAYLTYVQLPWYTIIEDILKSGREPLF